jgi:hypothetical protein
MVQTGQNIDTEVGWWRQEKMQTQKWDVGDRTKCRHRSGMLETGQNADTEKWDV